MKKGKRHKIVVDTNIFISSWFQESVECDKILQLIKDRKVTPLFGQDTIGELVYLVKNFARHNIDEISERIILLHGVVELFYNSLSVNTMSTKIEETKDKYDDMFLKVALEGKADYLITDDIKNGLLEREFDNLIVATSTDFVKMYEEANGEITVSE